MCGLGVCGLVASTSRLLKMIGLFCKRASDISSIDHLVMREFVSGSPRYHLAIKGVREQFVVLEKRCNLNLNF